MIYPNEENTTKKRWSALCPPCSVHGVFCFPQTHNKRGTAGQSRRGSGCLDGDILRAPANLLLARFPAFVHSSSAPEAVVPFAVQSHATIDLLIRVDYLLVLTFKNKTISGGGPSSPLKRPGDVYKFCFLMKPRCHERRQHRPRIAEKRIRSSVFQQQNPLSFYLVNVRVRSTIHERNCGDLEEPATRA